MEETIENRIKKFKDDIERCRKCEFCSDKKIIGEGFINPRVMFVKSYPSGIDIIRGKTFSDKSGEILKELLEKAGYKEEDYYFTYISKCHPRYRKKLCSDEIKNCKEYFIEQIKLVNPTVICAIGAKTKMLLTEKNVPLLKINTDSRFTAYPIFCILEITEEITKETKELIIKKLKKIRMIT